MIDFTACKADIVVDAWEGGSIAERAGTIHGIGTFRFGVGKSTLVATSSANGNVWDLTDWARGFQVSAAPPVLTAGVAFISPSSPSSYSVHFSASGTSLHVVGGTTADVFRLSDQSRAGVASIDGGDGRNTLDLSRCTQNVYVNL